MQKFQKENLYYIFSINFGTCAGKNNHNFMKGSGKTMNIKQTDDLMLWDLLIQGDRNALEVLYKKYYSILLNYGLKYTQDKELIKDSIHDLFVNLYQNKKINIQNISVQAYLMKSLKNNLLYKLIGEKRTGESLDELSFEIPTDEDLFEQIFPQNDHYHTLAKNLLKAIQELSPNQRSILYLRYVKELSHKEIAEILDINEQSSMNSTHRALHKLRSLMEKDGTVLDLIYIIFMIRSIFI